MADDGVKAVAAPEPAALDDENDDARSVDSDELDSLEQTSNMDQDKYDDFVATCQVLPECVYTGMESKEHYAASMRKAHTLSVDTLETAREHRWKLAEQKLSRRSMCSPTSVLRKRWDAAQVFLLFYVAIFVPYRIGFEQDTYDPATGSVSFFFFVDILVDLYFFCDIFLSFRTGYVDSRGELQYKGRLLVQHYLKTWFWIDVASCLPFNYIAMFPGLVTVSQDDARSNRLLKTLRLLRLLKLLRLMRINRIIQRYEAEFHVLLTSMKLAKLGFLILGLGHWLCCAWYYCGSIESTSLDPNGKKLVGWVQANYHGSSADRGFMSRYFKALYWSMMTMTTVGYGDIPATTVYETVCAIVGMVIGGFVFGMIVGNLSEVSRRANPSKSMQNKLTGTMFAFLMERGVTQQLTRRITGWYLHHLTTRTAMENEKLLMDLPAQFRDELGIELGYCTGNSALHTKTHYSLVHKVPFLSDLDNVSMMLLCLRMKCEKIVWENTDLWVDDDDEPEKIERDESPNLIMREGQPALCMSIISSGDVEVSQGGEILGNLGKGDFFGELAILRHPASIQAGIAPPLHVRSAEAKSNVLYHTLSADDFAELCLARPAISKLAWPFISKKGGAVAGGSAPHDEVDNETGVEEMDPEKAARNDATMGRMETCMMEMEGRMDRLEYWLQQQQKRNTKLLSEKMEERHTQVMACLDKVISTQDAAVVHAKAVKDGGKNHMTVDNPLNSLDDEDGENSTRSE